MMDSSQYSSSSNLQVEFYHVLNFYVLLILRSFVLPCLSSNLMEITHLSRLHNYSGENYPNCSLKFGFKRSLFNVSTGIE